ncbi:IS256 family transposase [Cardinium endosymbiont cEper1 of Encarsia pergandiella]|nr:IS256 family transposase [Cardinium endosymbiont cEper1 of Encarsia pergandiella]CCM10275.1 IS256 family transposase [Cardinium endosymbiont cEper1 of Encarsia pergandiella]CCM10516.1 IS256 family transposase [Cardinium endosymbiont cEper1 of Encarsia pergandiella]CCM10617.1 IS256 family transposase [Cardinium endosymbiont cEper1 of Encarsia pergandiella]
MESQQINIDPNLLKELSKSIKSEKDLAILSKQLLKLTVERAMDAELDDHLGYSKHSIEGRNTGNSRNGYSLKRLKGDFGEMEINRPRDRNSTFDPQIVRKGQTRFTDFDEQILSLYARGMTTRDISDTFKELYGREVSHSLISKVTESVIEEITIWQNRPLESVYPPYCI